MVNIFKKKIQFKIKNLKKNGVFMKWIIEFKKMVNLFKWLCDLVFLYKLSTMGYYDMVVYSMSQNLVAWIGQINSLQTNQWSSFFCFSPLVMYWQAKCESMDRGTCLCRELLSSLSGGTSAFVPFLA